MPMLSAESKPQIAFDELKEDSPLGLQSRSQSLALALVLAPDWLPGLVGVVGLLLFGQVGGLRPQVFLVYGTVLIDDEGHHSGVAVLRGIGHEGEAASHFPIHDVALGATFCVSALRGKYAVVVAVERLRSIVLAAVTLSGGIGHQRADGALGLAFGNLPIESVLLAGVADEFLRVLFDRVAIVGLAEVLVLRVSQSITHTNGRQLVLANAAEEYLLHARFGVEVPGAGGVLLQRNGERPVFRAKNKGLASVDLFGPAIHLLIALGEAIPAVLVLHLVAGGEDAGGRSSENGLGRGLVRRFRGVVERLASVLRIGEGLLPGLLGPNDPCEQDERRQQQRSADELWLPPHTCTFRISVRDHYQETSNQLSTILILIKSIRICAAITVCDHRRHRLRHEPQAHCVVARPHRRSSAFRDCSPPGSVRRRRIR